MLPSYDPIVQALFGSLFTWAVTAAGASLVFLFERENKKLLDSSLGFAAGVMTAASFWSLLSPALELSSEIYGPSWGCCPVALGFLLGAYFVYKSEFFLQYFHLDGLKYVEKSVGKCENEKYIENNNGIKKRKFKNANGIINDRENFTNELITMEGKITWRRIMLLILAITVHNIPEGLAVGVGFGAAGQSSKATFESARNLALGIGIQNFPEGLAVSLPLIGLGYTKKSAFFWGQLSGVVEPLAALSGAYLVRQVRPLLPYALAFAAGAMIFVVFDDLVPESHKTQNAAKLSSWCAIFGFVVMMCLDVGLS